MSRSLTIAGRDIGPDHPPYIVAEISANHGGRLEHALEIMHAAAEAGADAVKLQTYTADTITIDHDGPEFRLTEGPWAGRTLHDLYDWAHTPWDWHEALFRTGRELGLAVFSSPFDPSAVDFLERFDPPAYKIASFELIDLPLVAYVAAKGRPMILSTGMASRDEIAEAVGAARSAGCRALCLLHCTSGYPTPAAESDLRTIPDLADRLDVVTGLSDHTLGTAVAVASVALGAALIEKHVTLNRADGGPDAAFSLEPAELTELVAAARTAWQALGRPRTEPKPSEAAQRPLRRSLYVVRDVRAGERFTADNVRSIRPGLGLPPRDYASVIGRPARRDVARGTALAWDMIGD